MSKPSRIKEFTVEGSVETIQKSIIKFGQSAGFKIDDFNEHTNTIIFSEGMSGRSYGLFYPVYITKLQNGNVKVEVGIKPKVSQIGPALTISHEKCFNGIKAAVYAGSNN